MAVRAMWLNPTGASGQTREDSRIASGMWMNPDTPTKATSGIRSGSSSGTEPFDLQASSAMACTIKPGLAFIQGTAAQGGYSVYSDADKTLTFSAGHATLPRLDLVYLGVKDAFINGSGPTEADIYIVEGTPASVPVAPALPFTSAIPLWTVRVNAGVSAGNGGINSNPGWSSARSDMRWYTVAAGGILPAGGAWSGTYPGQYRDNGTTLERWSGSDWEKPFPLGYLDNKFTDTDTIPLDDTGPWLLVDLGVITMTWSSERRYKITCEATVKSDNSAPNGGYLDLRYKTGPSIPNDQNPGSSTLLRNVHVGFDADDLPIPLSMVRIHVPSVTEQGTIGLFWRHDGTGESIVEGGMQLLVEDIGRA